MKRRLIAKKPFEFSARVTLQLGRESISSSTVAISEIIKNSYDADACNVSVDFHIRPAVTSSLVIMDDGCGMSVEDVEETWLRVGTENKKTNEYTRSGSRVYTGAKGLGRLGMDRLCKRLILYTKTKGMNHAVQVNVNWREYENSAKNASEIEHDIYEVELPIRDKYGEFFVTPEESGTRIVLLGLKDTWDAGFIRSLENELRLLLSPFKAKNDFSISLAIHQNSETAKKDLSSEEFLSMARWKVRAKVSRSGEIAVDYYNNEKRRLIEERHLWKDWIKNSGDVPQFGPVEFEFYYLPQDLDNLEKVSLKRKDFQGFMRLNRGVRIYRDYFRVKPYGEPSGKGDWLDIGYRKASSPGGIAQGGWRIAPNQLLGSVLISRITNSVLNDQANREGIIENDAFFQLRTLLLKVIEEFEFIAHKDAASNKSERNTASLGEFNRELEKDVEAASKKLQKSIGTVPTYGQKRKLASDWKDFEKAQQKKRKAEKEYYESLENKTKQLEEQKNTLSNLASLGILTVCFGHEIRQHTSQASANALEIQELMYDAQDTGNNIDFQKCVQISEVIQRNIQYIERFSSLAISNIKPDKRTRKKVNVPAVFRYVFDLMSCTFSDMGINYGLVFKGIDEADFNVFAFEIDWESTAINLVTNSMWAMEGTHRNKRVIEVEFEAVDDFFNRIRFRDSGIGLEEGSSEAIFMPMRSGKRDKSGNIVGTGMGLAIVRSQIEDHIGGQLTARAQSVLGGAEFIFTLPVSKK